MGAEPKDQTPLINPQLKEWASDRQAEYLDAVNRFGGFKAAARALGVSHDRVRISLKTLQRTAELGVRVLDAWDRLRDIPLAAKECGLRETAFSHRLRIALERKRQNAIAPNITDGFVVREVTKAYDGDGELAAEWVREGPAPSAESGGEGAGPARDGTDPYHIWGVSTLYGPAGEQRAQWVKTKADDRRRWEQFQAAMKGAADELPRIPPIEVPERTDDDLVTVYPQGDPHCGLYSWEAETGAKFDLEEFERINRSAFEFLVQQTPPSSLAIYNDKGDSTHADNSKNRTPRSGHELDVHGRHNEVVRVAMRVKRYHIGLLLQKHKKVIVRVDPGNHDVETAPAQSLILEAIYENDPRVEVIASPNPFWYYRFGSNLFGTCHGDLVKSDQLPLLMATDQPEWWGQTYFRTWFVGHVHHLSVKEYNGCDVEHYRTLAASDAHHHKSGYRSKRDLKAITYHRLDGELMRQTCSLRRMERLIEEAKAA